MWRAAPHRASCCEPCVTDISPTSWTHRQPPSFLAIVTVCWAGMCSLIIRNQYKEAQSRGFLFQSWLIIIGVSSCSYAEDTLNFTRCKAQYVDYGHLPNAGVLEDTHDPLDPVHGHTLLETTESWKRNKLYYESHELSWLRGQGCATLGLCETWTRSLPLWSGSVGSIKVEKHHKLSGFQNLFRHGPTFHKT